MKNDESEDDQAAYNHVTRCPARFDVISFAIIFRPRAPVLDRQQNREINVQNHSHQQKNADEPQNRPQIAEMLGVGVDPFRSKINLEVAYQMTKHEQDQDHSSHGDDHLSSNRGMAKLRDKTVRPYPHRCGSGSFWFANHLLPGFTAGIFARSGGNLSAAKFSTFISTKLRNGQPKSGFLSPLRSTITPTAVTIPPWARTISIVS